MDDPTVTVRYWAGARAAAGVDTEEVSAGLLSEVSSRLVEVRPALSEVLPRCTLLVDGVRSGPETPLAGGELVEVLPPFAGG